MCRSPHIEVPVVHLSRCSGRDSEVYQTGLVRVPPKVDAIGNRVGFAVIEAAVIPNPEEICSKRRLRIWPCTDDSNSQCIRGGCSSGAVSPSISATQLPTDAELERPTKHRRDQILFLSGSLGAWCSRADVHLHTSPGALELV